jgi:hypothetical protein
MATQEKIDEGAEKILQCFNSNRPFLIGRNGSSEISVFNFWFKNLNTHLPWPPSMLLRLNQNFGVWPLTNESLNNWCKDYHAALSQMDGISAGWFKPLEAIESAFIKAITPSAFTMPLRCLEPYYVEPDLRWTATLADKDVAVVTSFTKTIQNQLDRIDPLKIWSSVEAPETILPPARWHLIKSYFPPNVSGDHETGWLSIGITSWEMAVDHLVTEVLKTGATHVIIGCGAIGMNVAGRLRKKGLSVILLGGAVQVLFGIRGKRWQNHDVISRFWNNDWVWPVESERPPNANTVEGACYW